MQTMMGDNNKPQQVVVGRAPAERASIRGTLEWKSEPADEEEL